MDGARGRSGEGGGVAQPLRDAARRFARWAGASGLARRFEEERARWFVWLPVAVGAGIAVYFTLAAEPGLWTALALPLAGLGVVVAASRGAGLLYVAALGLLAATAGFAVAKLRTEWMRAPVLAFDMRRADIDGVVELIEKSPTRGARLTIRVTAIKGLEPGERPARIRVRAMTLGEPLQPGDTIRLRATLRPPSMPALPGDYDFARWAWFQGLGATGYAMRAPERIARLDEEVGLIQHAKDALERLRHAIGERIRTIVPGETGAIAVSLITGERNAITERTNAAYRDSGLVHILSISGLHMAIMAGFVYGAIRSLLAAVPSIALRYPTKKWAAVAALVGAAGYLLISGSSIPAVRAFLMISIMFVAVMLDRQALAMRNVAIAALAVLLLMPESLLDPGFQMSFAAVVSLIAAYEAVRGRTDGRERGGWVRTGALFLGGIVLSTVIASLSVAPIGAFHFHRSQQYALLANLVAIPICNLIVMPAALVTLVLMPLGLESLPLAVMAKGIDIMTATAERVAALPGAVIGMGAISDASFALMIAGGLWLTLWQTRWRVLGLAAIGGGVLISGSTANPDILVGRGGDLVAVRGADGRLAATGTGRGGFELTRWLQHDGDDRPVREVLKTRAFQCDGVGCTTTTQNLRIAVARHPAAMAEDCVRAEIVVAVPRVPRDCTASRLVIDRRALRREGTHAIYLAPADGGAARIARVETVAGLRGDRPWAAARPRPVRTETVGRHDAPGGAD